MNRKHFISSVFPFAASLTGFGNIDNANGPTAAITIPPYLKKGDTIGITCPAGFITAEEIEPSLNKLTEWGFKTIIGKTVGKKDFTYGGTDEERRIDLQQMLDDKNIQAILCARGGYGSVRIIDKIDFRKFALHPKWIIGFSDITVLHSHLNRNYGIASIHSKMCNSFPADWKIAEPMQKETIESIQKCLAGEKMSYHIPANPNNKNGHASGTLVGGNLKTIESLTGSSSDIVTKNKLLFVEDTGEYLYSIDRMFWNLRRSGKLEKLSGLIVGGFKIKKDDEGEAFGKTLEQIVLEKVTEYNYPVCFDFPVGHQKNNFALKCGVKHELALQPDLCTLTEIQ
ncbi:MAG: LD-carboxypeptidase [Ferruginibacter sp.]